MFPRSPRIVLVAGGLAMSLVASASSASCPEAADLARGVVVGFEDGSRTLLKRLDNGAFLVDEAVPDDFPLRLHAYHGIYTVAEFDAEEPVSPAAVPIVTSSYSQDAATLPAPTAGGGWIGQVTTLLDDGESWTDNLTARVIEAPAVVLSGCSYETVRVELFYLAEGTFDINEIYTEVYTYLPVLGVGFYIDSPGEFEDQPALVPVSLELATK